mmetsp:Transcript_11475/g.20745  ORF Transcript_11475/g.20745 Transcript_11475/m.20745 type:complete len:206 (-) Transcript_11475:804-1421(-)
MQPTLLPLPSFRQYRCQSNLPSDPKLILDSRSSTNIQPRPIPSQSPPEFLWPCSNFRSPTRDHSARRKHLRRPRCYRRSVAAMPCSDSRHGMPPVAASGVHRAAISTFRSETLPILLRYFHSVAVSRRTPCDRRNRPHRRRSRTDLPLWTFSWRGPCRGWRRACHLRSCSLNWRRLFRAIVFDLCSSLVAPSAPRSAPRPYFPSA